MPDREKTRAGSRRASRRLRRTRWHSSLRKVRQRLGFRRATVLLVLWLLATAALISVALALNADGNRGTCTETAAMICLGPAPGHSPGSPSENTTTGQVSQQRVADIVAPPSW
jgi:hypothetical protein